MARIGFLRLIFCAAFLLGILIGDARACSEVFIDKGGKVKVSARNFDFPAGNGFVRYSPAGTDRQAQYAPQDYHPLKWTSKYASVTFNASLNKTKSSTDGVYEAGVDGINQAGLKVGTYFLGSSIFPKDGVKTILDIASLLQYQLDNFKSVDEALADLAGERYRITSTPTESVEIKLHLLLHDSTGRSAIVEFIDGKIKVTRNPEIPVLTNDTYAKSLEHLKLYNGFGDELAIPGGIESLDRFVRGAYYWKNLPVPANSIQATDYGFAATQLLTVPPKLTHGGTQWTIVTDIDNRRIYFRTANNPTIASIDLNKLSASVIVSSDIDLLRIDFVGDVSSMFDKISGLNLAPGQSLGIASVPNLRDIGGYKTRNSAVVRRGLVYRASQLNPISPDDLKKIARLGLVTDYDLRTAQERNAGPDELLPGVKNVWLNVLADEKQSVAARIEDLLRNPKEANVVLGGGKTEAVSTQVYRDLISLPSAKQAYHQLFVSLGKPDQLPALFHCTAGKDRTGWAAAALLTLLGVPKDKVMEDYLRSNEYILPTYQTTINAFVAAGGDRAIPMAVLRVKTEYLDAAFDEIKKKHGTIENYFSEALGIDAAGQKTLRDLYLEMK